MRDMAFLFFPFWDCPDIYVFCVYIPHFSSRYPATLQPLQSTLRMAQHLQPQSTASHHSLLGSGRATISVAGAGSCNFPYCSSPDIWLYFVISIPLTAAGVGCTVGCGSDEKRWLRSWAIQLRKLTRVLGQKHRL